MCSLPSDTTLDEFVPDGAAWTRDPKTGDTEPGEPLIKDYYKKDGPSTGLKDLKNLPGDDKNAFTPSGDGTHTTFKEALDHINPDYRITLKGGEEKKPTSVHDDEWSDLSSKVASGGLELAGKWGDVRDEISRVTKHFNDALDSLMHDKEHWHGKTKIKAFENVRNSFAEPEKVTLSAGVMQTLLDAFARTIDYVYRK